jgi:hypothetical protein
MLFIDSAHPDIQYALAEHSRFVCCLIKKKLDRSSNCTCGVCKSEIESINDKVPERVLNILSDDAFVFDMVNSLPGEIAVLSDMFYYEYFGADIYDRIIIALGRDSKNLSDEDKFFLCLKKNIDSVLAKFFDYKGWFNANEPSSYYSAYHLATSLNLRSCVYCNRTYALTQFKMESDNKIGKLLRPDFDHWYPKEHFPLLALSFFNLVPCCSVCNSSVKGRKKFTLADYVHPYVDNITESILFSFKYSASINSVKVELTAVNSDKKLQQRIENTLTGFHIEEMYGAHEPELLDLIKLKQAYSENYLKTLRSAFPGIKLTDNEMYRLAFGVELSPKDFQKRPFSKFKYDILKELKVI